MVKDVCALFPCQADPSWIVWVHGLVPALTVASRMAGGDGDQVMVRRWATVGKSSPYLGSQPERGVQQLSYPHT